MRLRTISKTLTTLTLGALAMMACGEDISVYQIDFNDELTNNYGPAGTLLVEPTFVPNDPYAPTSATKRVTDAYPINIQTSSTPRSQFYWVPAGSSAGLTWEVWADVSSSGGTVVNQEVGACTLTQRVSRRPVETVDGDSFEISEDDWKKQTLVVTPELRTCTSNGLPYGGLAANDQMCNTTATLPCTINSSRAPLCAPECVVPVATDSTFTVAMNGIWNGTAMPQARKTFSTTFMAVDGPRVIRRPLTYDTQSHQWTWRTPGPVAGPWQENFDPLLFISNVRVISHPPGMPAAAQPVSMSQLSYRNAGSGNYFTGVCPLPPTGTVTYFNRVRCPGLGGMNPTILTNDVTQLIEWWPSLHGVPAGEDVFIEFTISRNQPGGLTASPGRYDPVEAYPEFYERLEELIRLTNWTKSDIRITGITTDKNGWVHVDPPEDQDLPPGASQSLTVSVQPDGEGEREETITIRGVVQKTGEELTTKVLVPISSHTPAFTITPNDAISPVLMNSWYQSRIFTIENVSNDVITVQSAGTIGHPGLRVSSGRLPYKVAPGATWAIMINYDAQVGPPSNAAFTVQTDHGSRNVALYCSPAP